MLNSVTSIFIIWNVIELYVNFIKRQELVKNRIKRYKTFSPAGRVRLDALISYRMTYLLCCVAIDSLMVMGTLTHLFLEQYSAFNIARWILVVVQVTIRVILHGRLKYLMARDDDYWLKRGPAKADSKPKKMVVDTKL